MGILTPKRPYKPVSPERKKHYPKSKNARKRDIFRRETTEIPPENDEFLLETAQNPEVLEQDLPDFSEEELLASLCRSSFADFVKEFWHVVVPEKLIWNWHLQYLCEELQKTAERVFLGLPRLEDVLINISPGSSKSTIASIMLPAWIWTRMPSARIISASYAYSLATDLSRKSRDIVVSELYQRCFPGIDIREDQNSKGYFVNTKGGERYAIGIDGGVTGKHAHFIIVDDPLDPRAAASAADLKSTNQWMEETLPSRKVDKAVTPTILIMQRLDEFDPAGAMLEKSKKVPVKHICIPAELTDDVKPVELRKFYIDGLMDPVRLSYDTLAEVEAGPNGAFVLASQYHQTPIPRGGAMFLVDKLVTGVPPERFRQIVRYWDKAGTAGGGHFTVGAKMAVDFLGHFWILDIVRGQWNSGNRERIIQQVAKNDGRGVIVYVEQEPGSGGLHSAEGTIRNLAGFIVRKHRVGKSDGDKEARADAFSSQVNIGNVSMVRAHWNAEYINELRFFPKSKYKDQVDASAGGFNMVAQKVTVVGGSSVLNNS